MQQLMMQSAVSWHSAISLYWQKWISSQPWDLLAEPILCGHMPTVWLSVITIPVQTIHRGPSVDPSQ